MGIEVINKITAVPEETPVINVSMTNPMYQGPKGDKGDKGDRGDLGPIGPKGDQGPIGPQGKAGLDGKSGVHVGSEAPTDPDATVWIDLDGRGIELKPAEEEEF